MTTQYVTAMAPVPAPNHSNTATGCVLTLAIALALGAAQPAAAAVSAPLNVVVSNCNDGGPGSLREALFQALDGDTVDASQLACSTITLATGHLVLGQSDLTLLGPGADHLAIVANYHFGYGGGGVFLHTGTGVLTISGVYMTRGAAFEEGGGCIRSEGGIHLRDSVVSGCLVFADAGDSALGGAILANGVVELDRSVVSHGRAGCMAPGNVAQGGGIYSRGGLVMRQSRISVSKAYGIGCPAYCGAAVVTGGSVTISGSTIYSNLAESDSANGNVGGICALAGEKYGMTIGNSTIAYNSASGAFGGVYSNTSVTLRNSTIAANHAGDAAYAAGLHVQDNLTELQSSIIANNIAGAAMLDLGANGTVVGSNNLVRSSGVAPPDSLTADPALSALADHGGRTPTMALAGWSPALDRGNNAAGYSEDQRGPGFPRISGAAADIGAFEMQIDRIFRNGFDPAPSG